MPRVSIATVDAPEFINITPYNPLISKCEIKVLYVGENRNHSLITKEVAEQMANSLPGCPIVGYYDEGKEILPTTGKRIVIENNEIKFQNKTFPYGFIAPNAKVWFKDFVEADAEGKEIIRKYLMTEGFLWTGQYEECQRVIDEGNNQSMELDKDSLQGEWTKSNNSNVEFFIISDAIFSKLCILGEDVEPCFEGADVTKPNISSSFTKVDDEFTRTLFQMMNELKFALQNQKGGQTMAIQSIPGAEEVKDATVGTEVPAGDATATDFAKKDEKNQDDSEKDTSNKNEDTMKAEEDKDKDKKSSDKFAADDKKDEDKDDADNKKDDDEADDDKKEKFACGDDDKKKKDYALEEIPEYVELSTKYSDLEARFQALETEMSGLRAFKLEKENEAKDALIKSFYMLSEEDMKDVVDNKANYSLDDIEAKLSVIAVRKKVNFSLDEDESKEDKDAITTFNLSNDTSNVPAWVKAVKKTAQNR